MKLTAAAALQDGIAKALRIAAECEREGNASEARRHRERAQWYQSSLALETELA